MRGFYQGESNPEEIARLKADRDRLIAIPDKLAMTLPVDERYRRLRYLREMELMLNYDRQRAMTNRQVPQSQAPVKEWGRRDDW